MGYARPKPPAGGIKANYPGFIEPALATSINKVPSGERWIHQIKFTQKVGPCSVSRYHGRPLRADLRPAILELTRAISKPFAGNILIEEQDGQRQQ